MNHSLFAATAAALLLCSCGDDRSETSVRVTPPQAVERPESPKPKTIADLKAKVGPLVELTATRQGEPGRYERLGSRRFNDLNNLSRWAALWVATSTRCDRLIDMDTRQSTREELAWVGKCENGSRYWVFEEDVAAVKSEISERGDTASISDLTPPVPTESTPYTMMELLAACQQEFNAFLPDDQSYIGDGYTGGKRQAGKANFRVTGTLSSNAFSDTKTSYNCTVSDRRQVQELRYDIGQGVQIVRPED